MVRHVRLRHVMVMHVLIRSDMVMHVRKMHI
jgi:hypothetical protein